MSSKIKKSVNRGYAIREATTEDFDQIRPIFREIARAGETYAFPRDITREQAQKIWMDNPKGERVSNLESPFGAFGLFEKWYNQP